MKLKSFGRALGPAGAILVLLIIGLGVAARPASAPSLASFASGDFFFPPYSSDSDRMGIGGSIGMYNPALQAGWYMDWGSSSNPSHPAGLEYAQTIYLRVHDTGSICGARPAPASQRSQVTEDITGTALIDNLRANPGALWLIGNEPDSIYNGNPIMPELYAELYHEFYTFIKTHDPSARVAIGAVVQPSPLRLEYLDKALNHYQAVYGEKLPTALWNIHLYAFREVACDYGAGTPPGASHDGWSYDWPLWSDADLAAQHLREMRQWLADKGERDKPLIVTEFGQLLPDDGSYCYGSPSVCVTQETSRTTLQNDFNYFLTLTDPLTGYPADGNRLIQLWAWYSLKNQVGYGGDLINSDGTLTLAGRAFAEMASQRFVPYVDLYPVPLITPTLPASSSGPISVSLAVQLDNRGNTLARSVPMRFSQYDTSGLLTSDLITVSQVLTRYGGVQPQVSREWQIAPATLYTFTFEIDPAQTISQARRSPQQLTYVVGQPDLAITLLESDYASVFYWEQPLSATITTTVRNTGYTTSTASLVQLSASIAGGTAYAGQAVAVPALAPGASAQVTGTQGIPSLGAYVVTATLQPGGLDANAQNNIATLSLLATAPDLTITALTSDQRNVDYQGRPITQTITATIRNLGRITSFPGKVEFGAALLDGGLVILGKVGLAPALAPGESAPVTATLVISSLGVHVITATVQYDYVELDRQNNTATLNILAASHWLYLPVIAADPKVD